MKTEHRQASRAKRRLFTDLVARAEWHLQMVGMGRDDQAIDERGEDDFHEPATCWKCGGSGTLVMCCDDLCHGQDYCMHGDNDMCSECDGEGFL